MKLSPRKFAHFENESNFLHMPIARSTTLADASNAKNDRKRRSLPMKTLQSVKGVQERVKSKISLASKTMSKERDNFLVDPAKGLQTTKQHHAFPQRDILTNDVIERTMIGKENLIKEVNEIRRQKQQIGSGSGINKKWTTKRTKISQSVSSFGALKLGFNRKQKTSHETHKVLSQEGYDRLCSNIISRINKNSKL